MQLDPRRSVITIECPKSMVGRVIGKNGETIKALQTYTGSLIQVNQVEDPCQISISGTPQSLSLATSMISDIINGTFKGFALLRQMAAVGVSGRTTKAPAPAAALPAATPSHSISQPMYAPGYGLIPPAQSTAGDGAATTAAAWPSNPAPVGMSPANLLGNLVPMRTVIPVNPSATAPSHSSLPPHQVPMLNASLSYPDLLGRIYAVSPELSSSGLAMPTSATQHMAAGMPQQQPTPQPPPQILLPTGSDAATANWLSANTRISSASAASESARMSFADSRQTSARISPGNISMDADGHMYYTQHE